MGTEGGVVELNAAPQSRAASLQVCLGLCTHPLWSCVKYTFLLVVAPFSMSLYSLRL